jgi:hypothetical protein
MLDVARNLSRLGVVSRGRRTSDVGCCTQHGSQHEMLNFDLTANDRDASNPTAAKASYTSVDSSD